VACALVKGVKRSKGGAVKLTDRLAGPDGGVRWRMRIRNLPVKKDRRKSKVPFDPQGA
jgi:hypothetical protein